MTDIQRGLLRLAIWAVIVYAAVAWHW